MRKLLTGGALAAALFGCGVLAAGVTGGDGSVETADRIGPFPEPVEVAMEPADATAAGKKKSKKKAKKPSITYLVSTDTRSVAGGQSDFVFSQCPKGQIPLDMGEISEGPGLSIDYVSRYASDLSRAPRTYYIGVSNNTGQNIDWLPTLNCGKGFKEK